MSSCKVPLFFCYILMKLEFSRQIFEKYSNTKCHENPCSGSGVFPCGQTDERKNRRKGGQIVMTKLTVTFRNFANALKKSNSLKGTATRLWSRQGYLLGNLAFDSQPQQQILLSSETSRLALKFTQPPI